MITIGIDIDDTITNTNCLVRRYFRNSNNKELIDNMEDIIKGFYVNDTTIEFYKSLNSVFLNQVKLKKGVVEVIDQLHSIGYRIIFITARNDNYYGDAYKMCSDFLDKNGIKYDKLIIDCPYKTKIIKEEKIDILIDDVIDIIDEAKDMGVDSILVSSSLNRGKKTKGKRVNNWNEIYNYISKKYRTEIITVVAGLVEKDNKYLIARRSTGLKDAIGSWEFPGGKIEEGENEQNSVKREIKEELEIDVKVKEFLVNNIYPYPTKTIDLRLYKCEYISGDIVLHDHFEYKWIEKDKILDYNFAPADIPLAEFVYKNDIN